MTLALPPQALPGMEGLLWGVEKSKLSLAWEAAPFLPNGHAMHFTHLTQEKRIVFEVELHRSVSVAGPRIQRKAGSSTTMPGGKYRKADR